MLSIAAAYGSKSFEALGLLDRSGSEAAVWAHVDPDER